MQSIAPFLLFVDKKAPLAEEAVRFYISLFDNSEITHIEYYGADDIEPEGTVKIIKFTLGGVEHRASASTLNHQFDFTPALSFFIECDSERELTTAVAKLADGGQTMMPVDNYGFSQKFGWVQDKYGVNWQLNFCSKHVI